MRFSIVTLAVLAATGSGSAFILPRQTPLPQCVITCLADPNLDIGDCQSTDNVCLCKNQAFVAATTACVITTCHGADLTNALAGMQAACAAVGVPI